MDEVEKLLRDNATLTPQVFRTRVVKMSNNKLYAALKRGEIESVRIGRDYHILTAPLRRKLGLEAA